MFVSFRESKGSALNSTLTLFTYVLHFALLCLVEALRYKQSSKVICEAIRVSINDVFLQQNIQYYIHHKKLLL